MQDSEVRRQVTQLISDQHDDFNKRGRQINDAARNFVLTANSTAIAFTFAIAGVLLRGNAQVTSFTVPIGFFGIGVTAALLATMLNAHRLQRCGEIARQYLNSEGLGRFIIESENLKSPSEILTDYNKEIADQRDLPFFKINRLRDASFAFLCLVSSHYSLFFPTPRKNVTGQV